jgi:hypothetical protein
MKPDTGSRQYWKVPALRSRTAIDCAAVPPVPCCTPTVLKMLATGLEVVGVARLEGVLERHQRREAAAAGRVHAARQHAAGPNVNTAPLSALRSCSCLGHQRAAALVPTARCRLASMVTV